MVEAQLLEGQHDALLAGDAAPLLDLLNDPAAQPALSDLAELSAITVASPALQLTLRLRRNGRQQRADGRLGPLLVITLDGVDDAPAHLIFGAADEFPRVVAELVDLGPRPLDDAWVDIVMPFEPLDAFAGVGCGAEILASMREAFPEYAPEVLGALFDGSALRWTLTVWPTDAGQGEAVELDVIDARDRGLWLIAESPQQGAVCVRPMTSSGLWILLSGMLGPTAAVETA